MAEIREFYMRAFLYELEAAINRKDLFKHVRFQLDEANTDKETKKAVKDFINNEINTIRTVQKVIIDGKSYDLKKDSFKVLKVIEPEEYTEKDKELVKTLKKGIYVNPDLTLTCLIEGKQYIEYLELKSTKTDKIPGSSVQQIVPDEWVLFIKHTDKSINTISGQYKYSISGTMQFPDRSPRPQVSYNELLNWIEDYRVFQSKTLEFKKDESASEKEELINDWQGVLSHRWMKVIQSKRKENGEPWFNNNLRKFVFQLLNYYDTLDKEKKEELKNSIERNIED